MTHSLGGGELTGSPATGRRFVHERVDRFTAVGFGNGPVAVASVIVAGGFLLGGVGLGRIAMGGAAAAAPSNGVVQTPGPTMTSTPAVASGPRVGPAPSSDVIAQPAHGRPHSDDHANKADSRKADRWGLPRNSAAVYTIEPGDTLTAISGETGIPIDLLVEVNKIQNPNLIYAGASLLIPPVD